MKLKSLIGLELKYRFAGLQALNLWAVQGGMLASMNRQPPSRIAAAAKEIADHKQRLGLLFQALDRIYPLGYSQRWNRKGVAV